MASITIKAESECEEAPIIDSGLCETSLIENFSVEDTIFPFDNLSVELIEEDVVQNTDKTANENQTPLIEINSVNTNHIKKIKTSHIQKIQTNKDLVKTNNECLSENIIAYSTVDEVKSFPLTFKQEIDDTITSKEKVQETYIESNILRQALSVSNISSNTEKTKPLPLSSFPKIICALKKADYSTLQKLYELLYERSAWESEEILIERISKFSGFNCEINSEEYFNKEIMLKTFPDEILLRIFSILSLTTVKSLQLEVEENRNEVIKTIMCFLYKPSKKRQTKQKSSSKKRMPVPKVRTSKKKNKKHTDKVSLGSKFLKIKISKPKKNKINDKKKHIIDEMQQILELEKDLKEKISTGKDVLQLKVCLTKLDLSSFCHLFDFSNSKNDKKNSLKVINNESSINKVDVKSESSINKVDVNSQLPIDNNNSKTRLRDIPIVLKSLEHTSEELLLDIHSLLFLKDAEMHELRDNILNFDGFTFGSDTEEYDERKDFLERMPNKIVSDVAKAFSLKVPNNKDETIEIILGFLNKMDKNYSYLHSDISIPNLVDVEIDIEQMSDSDDSITCEIIEKKVECIDLISSGEDSDSDRPIIAKGTVETPKVTSPSSKKSQSQPDIEISNIVKKNSFTKKLRHFDTIKRIVNTHPHEYLTDLYELLFMKKPELKTIRVEILEFDGFKFLKGCPAYTKRKQMLDRMAYNSIRRIYNTLIHDISKKTFAKRTMIEEIFDFLLNLSNSDKAIPPSKVQKVSATPQFDPQKRPILPDPSRIHCNGLLGSTSTSKLSDLKRVFQRVACFPCEYLIDVHKLLFMTDCDPNVIRQNIFGFKGFSFSKDSPEFELRKKYLEYLTFHSLRKISSVLTTKSIDLRNSTKHELANHLTEVLAEFTNVYVETEPISASSKDVIPIDSLQETSNTEVENIVVTPCIETMPIHSLINEADSSILTTPEITNDSPVNNQVPSKESHSIKRKQSFSPVSTLSDIIEVDVQQNNVTSTDKKIFKSKVQSQEIKSSSSQSTNYLSSNNKEQKIITPIISLETPESSLTNKDNLSNKKRKLVAVPIQVSSVQINQGQNDQLSSMQFQDINLPEVAKYQQLYGSQLKIETPQTAVFQQALPSTAGVNISLVPTNFISTPIFNYAQSNIVFSPVMQPIMSTCLSPKPQITQPIITSISSTTQKTRTILPNISPKTEGIQSNVPNIYPKTEVMQPIVPNIYSKTEVMQPIIPSIYPQTEVMQPIVPNIYPKTEVMQPIITNLSPITQPIISKIESLSNLPNDIPLEPIPVKSFQEPVPKTLIPTNSENDQNLNHQSTIEEPESSLHSKIRNVINDDDDDDCNIPLAALLGHPNDKILKEQICNIVENSCLQDISINGVIQKIYDLYPEYDLGYRKEFIKSTLRSLLYKLGEAKASAAKSLSEAKASEAKSLSLSQKSDTQDCDVSTSDIRETPKT